MNRFLILFFILFGSTLVAQKSFEADSVKISEFKKKVILHINPNPDSALYYIKKSLEVVNRSNYQRGLADTEYLLAQFYKRTQQIDSALFYFESSAERSERENYNMGAAIAFNGLCRNLYLLARYDDAEKACDKALENIKTENELAYLTKADTYTALGTIYSRQDLIEKAQQHFLKVDSMHLLRPLRPDVIAAAYQNLGGIYMKFNELDLAESYHLKANQEFGKLPANAAEYYMNSNNVELGKLLYKKKDFARADSLLTISHIFFKKIKDLLTASEIATTLSKIKLQENNLGSAGELLNEAFEFHRQSDYKLEAANDALALANLSLVMGKPIDALQWANKAEILNDSIENRLIERDFAFVSASAYSKLGQYQKAMEFNKLGYAIKDSLAQIQTTERIREIEGKYQTTQRDREIALLKSRNELAEQKQKSQRNLLLGGIALTSIAGLFLFILYRNRQRTNKKLRDIDALKTNFFTNISHEFRTPLTLISAPIQESLEEPDLSKERRTHFEIAQKSTKRLSALVDQLLELSKINSGDRKLLIQKNTPTPMIAAWCESFSYLAQQKNIVFRTEIKSKDVTAWFDKEALENIVINLLANAVKYTPNEGEVQLQTALENDFLQIAIKNTGPGLTKVQTKTIFNRFYQTDGQKEGVGVGLSLVKELTELHGGNITVSSEPDKWTLFEVFLCTDRSKLKNVVVKEDVETIPKITSHHLEAGQPHKELEIHDNELPLLLLVEDNADVRKLLVDTFKKDYKILQAENGKKGVLKAMNAIPDIIISDVMMPIKDGIDLTRTLKKNELTSHIPIILLTAKAGDENELTGIETGADDYITKPFNQKLLKSKTASLVTLRKQLRLRYSQEVILKPKDIAITSVDEKFLERIQKTLDEKLSEPTFTSEEFSKTMHMSRMQLHRKLKALTGLSASEFIRSQRLKLASQLLKQSGHSVSEIGYSVGFNDAAYFTKCFREAYQYTPTEYSKQFNSPKA